MGEREDGLAQIADGLDQYRGLRTPPVFWPLVRYMQAAAHVDARKPDAGLPLIREALELAGEDEVLAPLFHIVHGDLLLLASDADAAEAAYERARDNAVRFGARLPHLRAATRLAGLEAEPATRDARLAVVRELVAAFDEGLDTADLIDARALIEAAAAH
jgi:adenylate cyclase